MSVTPLTALAQEAVQLNEITVTAEKRSEKASDVPISMDVQTSDTLERENITRRDQALSSAPNVQMGGPVSGSLYTNFTAIRGVGSALIDTDPAVGLYIDGVPVGASQGYSGSLLDVNRIEILRGPQGTLYGRNNLAGSVNIISNVPDATRSYGELGVDYGSYNTLRGFGFFNQALGSGWAVRGAFSGMRNDGYNRDVATGYRTNSLQDVNGRVTISGPINDKVDFLGSIEHERQKTFDGAFMTDADFRAGKKTFDILNPFNGTVDTTALRSQFTVKLDNGDRAVSLTGYRLNRADFQGNPFPQTYWAAQNAGLGGLFGVNNFQYRADNPFQGSYDQVTQEFRYESDHSASFKWVAGAYGEYSQGSREYGATATYDPGGGLAGSNANIQSKGVTDTISTAAFVDGTYSLTDRWKLFGGVRGGYDHKDFDYKFSTNNPAFVTGLGFLGIAFSPGYRSALSAGYVTPRIGTKYDINENLNVYMSASRGYKSGGFNTGLVSTGDEKSFDAEMLMSYEAGWKAKSADNRLTLNGAVFLMDWKNQQVQGFSALTGTTPIVNAPKSRSYGAELEAALKLDQHWTLNAGLGYVDATYVDFKNAPNGFGGIIDASGNQQQYISKYTGSIGANYKWNIGRDNLIGSADVVYQYRSGFYFDVPNTLDQPGYGLLNARIGAENERYAFYVWGLNLADQRYRVSSTNFGFGPLVAIGAPLTVGATFKLKFGDTPTLR